MLRKTTRRPSGKIAPACQVAWPGLSKLKYRRPLPSAFTRAVLPCEVKKNRACRGASPPLELAREPLESAAEMRQETHRGEKLAAAFDGRSG